MRSRSKKRREVSVVVGRVFSRLNSLSVGEYRQDGRVAPASERLLFLFFRDASTLCDAFFRFHRVVGQKHGGKREDSEGANSRRSAAIDRPEGKTSKKKTC